MNGELLQAVLVDEGSNIEYELDPVNPSDNLNQTLFQRVACDVK